MPKASLLLNFTETWTTATFWRKCTTSKIERWTEEAGPQPRHISHWRHIKKICPVTIEISLRWTEPQYVQAVFKDYPYSAFLASSINVNRRAGKPTSRRKNGTTPSSLSDKGTRYYPISSLSMSCKCVFPGLLLFIRKPLVISPSRKMRKQACPFGRMQAMHFYRENKQHTIMYNELWSNNSLSMASSHSTVELFFSFLLPLNSLFYCAALLAIYYLPDLQTLEKSILQSWKSATAYPIGWSSPCHQNKRQRQRNGTVGWTDPHPTKAPDESNLPSRNPHRHHQKRDLILYPNHPIPIPNKEVTTASSESRSRSEEFWVERTLLAPVAKQRWISWRSEEVKKVGAE